MSIFFVLFLYPIISMEKANKTIAAESVRKRLVYKKSKSAEKNVGKVLGKDAGKFAKGLMKMF